MKSNTHLTVNDLLTACQNAQSESVKSLLIQHNDVNLPVINAVIVPQRNHSDLVLFAGTPIQKNALAGAKPAPLHKTITPAVIATIEQLFNGSDITTKALNEIKTALIETQKHFEKLNTKQSPFNSNNFGGDL